MRALLLYPRFPKTFWSFDSVLEMVGRKSLIPPLGLVTVAALLPQHWDFRLVDCAVREPTEEDWEFADIVMLSAMIVQKPFMYELIAEAKRRGKPVVVGGPYATSVPEDAEEAGADYLVLDEGELTIPMFLADLEKNGLRQRSAGEPAFRFTANGAKPEVTVTPVARFDLLDMDAYDAMAIQYSRGCPFLCEFCDIITLYGRKPRTKSVEQMKQELDRLYELGWRRSIFLVDDNFIGNKPNVKKLLPELLAWQEAHDFPFWFDTEASIDLAADQDLMDTMVRCHFASVFIGIESPDPESLELTRKHQNNRGSMQEALDKVTRSGLRVMSGLIIGFDNEAPGAGQRIVRFIEQTNVPTALLSMLQVLPNTGLWHRLQKEGRLLEEIGTINQTTALNFVPTRPVAEIAGEYIEAYRQLYDPVKYLDRTYRYFLVLGADDVTRREPRPARRKAVKPRPSREQRAKDRREKLRIAGAFAKIAWRQGVKRETRWKFWHHLGSMALRNPSKLEHYLAVAAHNEHFLEYREMITRSIQSQIATMSDEVSVYRPPEHVLKSRVLASAEAPVLADMHMAPERTHAAAR